MVIQFLILVAIIQLHQQDMGPLNAAAADVRPSVMADAGMIALPIVVDAREQIVRQLLHLVADRKIVVAVVNLTVIFNAPMAVLLVIQDVLVDVRLAVVHVVHHVEAAVPILVALRVKLLGPHHKVILATATVQITVQLHAQEHVTMEIKVRAKAAETHVLDQLMLDLIRVKMITVEIRALLWALIFSCAATYN